MSRTPLATATELVRQYLVDHGGHTHRDLLDALPDLSAEAIRQSLNYLRDTKQATGARPEGHAATIYTITAKGERAVPSAADAQPVAGPRLIVTTGNYDGADLARRVVRAGAYDAFTLPSLMAGRLVHRRVG